MARKQNEYLADILGESSTPPLPSSSDEASNVLDQTTIVSNAQSKRPNRSGMTLLGRENALARIASGEVRQVTQLLIDPARVRIWNGNARIQARLNEASCRDLIDSIIAENGQKVPVILRRLEGDSNHEYELIAGTRRHFSISWLRANNYPDMRLLAHVAELDDEAAFRLADIENRARKDVTEIERARNYAEALHSHYSGHQTRMAERLKLSKGWLSRMIKIAALPDAILAAFPNLQELTLSPAYTLAQAMDDNVRAKAILNVAEQISQRNAADLKQGKPLVSGSNVFKALMSAGKSAPEKPKLFSAISTMGRPSLTVTSANRQGLTFRLHAGSGVTEDEALSMFRSAMAHHQFHGADK